jgi:hypothetical protein
LLQRLQPFLGPRLQALLDLREHQGQRISNAVEAQYFREKVGAVTAA